MKQTADNSQMNWNASGKNGAVAAGGADAVAAGVAMLTAGGNAADAAVATLLALTITDYGFFAIGGEIPFMIYDAQHHETKVLSGLGAAPRDPAAIKWFYDNGIPHDGNIKSAPVPGAFDLCVTALRLYGTISFADAVAPSVALLDRGTEDWHLPLSATFRKLVETEHKTAGPRDEKLRAVRDRFYTGDIADALEDFYIAQGGFLRKSDLAAHVTSLEDPVSIDYHGYTVYKCPPWTQGPSLCQMLRLLEGFDLKKMGHLSADYVHTLTESIKLAFADRDQYYGDPNFADVPLAALLSNQYTDLRRALIDPTAASTEIRPGDPIAMTPLATSLPPSPAPGGTTTCVTADRWGNVVAATPSANGPYSICQSLGIAHGNRLRSLNTAPGHPNRIEPGKRPRITLTPTLVAKDGKVIIAISVAGGDLQDQTTLNCLLNHIDFGLSPADAVTAPRFCTNHHHNSFRPDAIRKDAIVDLNVLHIDSTIYPKIHRQLTDYHHDVRSTSNPVATPVMLSLDPATGLIRAAGDPRTARHAAALD